MAISKNCFNKKIADYFDTCILSMRLSRIIGLSGMSYGMLDKDNGATAYSYATKA